MKTVQTTSAPHGFTRREGLLTLLGSAMALAGCGGGGGGGSGAGAAGSGGVAGVGGGGTGSFSVGPISGIGSIICNGVRFDDSRARVLDDDGVLHNRRDLKLGMMVRVKGKAGSRKDKNDEADEISFGSELLGLIDSINAPAKTFRVLGQTVQITATTVFEDSLTLPVLLAGDIVEVHGFVDPATNLMTATRIERKLLANVTAFKLQGRISNLSAAGLQIGTLTISFASGALPAGLTLTNDLLVRVRLATTPLIGTRTATRIRKVEAETEDRDEAEVKGTITVFTSAASFTVNGVQVDAGSITVPAGLKKGDRVEIEGRLVKGVLVAKKVELEDENDQLKFELHGTISGRKATELTINFTLTSSGGIVAKVTVVLSDVRFDNGLTAAGLLDGAKLEVKGVASSDGTIKATRIKLE